MFNRIPYRKKSALIVLIICIHFGCKKDTPNTNQYQGNHSIIGRWEATRNINNIYNNRILISADTEYIMAQAYILDLQKSGKYVEIEDNIHRTYAKTIVGFFSC